MSHQTGAKFAKIGLAAAVFAAAVPASMFLAGCAVAANEVETAAAPAPVTAPAAAPAAAVATATPPAPAAVAEAHAAAPAAVDATRIAAGRELFSNWGCNACHALSDAKASGAVGPSLDGDANLSQGFIVDKVTNGQGAMPAFGGQLTEKEIDDLAYYLVQVAKK